MRFFILSLIFLFGGTSFAGSDQFLLKGRVLSTCFVQVTEETVATNLDLTNSGHSSTKVATVQLHSNSLAFASAIGVNDDTGGKLVNTADPSQFIPYTLNYASTDTGRSQNGFIPPIGSPTLLDYIIGNTGFTADLFVNITPDANLVDGDYEANIVVSCTII